MPEVKGNFFNVTVPLLTHGFELSIGFVEKQHRAGVGGRQRVPMQPVAAGAAREVGNRSGAT